MRCQFRHNRLMDRQPYPAARAAAPALHEHFARHRQALQPGPEPVASLPAEAAIEALVSAAFWASLRREEGYVPKISLAYLSPGEAVQPLILERPLPLDPGILTRVAPAVER